MMGGLDETIPAVSKYKAFPPDGHELPRGRTYRVVKLTAKTKVRYEGMGWRFERTTLPEDDW
jgi:hypothetical protein